MSSIGSDTYEIHLIPHDLLDIAAYGQIFKSLELLSNSFEGLFNQINTRVEAEAERLKRLDMRIESIHARLKKLSGKKRAMAALSPSHYPVSPIHPYQPILFSLSKVPSSSVAKREKETESGGRVSTSKILHGASNQKLSSSEPLIHDHADSFCATIQHPCDPGPRQITGTGPFPFECISSASSLLMFNTNYNPYRVDFQSADLTGNSEVNAPSYSSETLSKVKEPIAADSEKGRSSSSGLRYDPEFDQVPVFEFPDQLPDLLGATNHLYLDESWRSESGLAPDTSFHSTSSRGTPFKKPTSERDEAQAVEADEIVAERKQDAGPATPPKILPKAKSDSLRFSPKKVDKELLSAIHSGKVLRNVPKGQASKTGREGAHNTKSYTGDSSHDVSAGPGSMLNMLLSSLALRRKTISTQEEENDDSKKANQPHNGGTSDHDSEWKA